jgi:hypothetical protein
MESNLAAKRYYTVMRAPDRIERLAGYSLAEALREFVFGDPEVLASAREGLKSAPEFKTVFKEHCCSIYGRKEWPVDIDRWRTIGEIHPDPQKRSDFDVGDPSPIEIVYAADALRDRFRALLAMLQQSKIEAWGLTENGHVERIPRPIWGHEGFHINAQGDVLQMNDRSDDPPFDDLIRCWTAVEFRAPQAIGSAFHEKPTASDDIRLSTRDHNIADTARRPSKIRNAPSVNRAGEALRAEQLVPRPTDLSIKAISRKIYLRLPDLSDGAREKAISRFYRRQSVDR